MGEVYTPRAEQPGASVAPEGAASPPEESGSLGAHARAVAARALAAHAAAAADSRRAVKANPRLFPAAGSRPPAAPAPASMPRWSIAGFSGRLSELSGVGAGAQLSLAFSLVREAQRRGEPVAWVTLTDGAFYPPDVAAGGVKLDALPVIFAPDPVAAARAADKLVRSGGFSAVVLDLVPAGAAPGKGATAEARSRAPREIPPAILSRLVGLAQKHDTALVLLTEKGSESPSLGGLVSLRCATARCDAGAGLFLCVAEALKDKRRGPGWSHTEVRRGPVGLR